MNTLQERRSDALKWWASLGLYFQGYYCERHYPERYHGSLTEREKEQIYRKEHLGEI